MNTQISGRKVVIQEPLDKIFKFLSHPYNFNSLMPPEVQKFEAGEDWFMFKLGSLPEVKLVVEEIVEPSLIRLKSANSKLDFELQCHFEAHENTTHARLEFLGQFNAMMKMMVQKPLNAFIVKLTDNLEKL